MAIHFEQPKGISASRIVLLVFTIIFLAFGGVGVVLTTWAYNTNQSLQNYKEARCTILSKTLRSKISTSKSGSGNNTTTSSTTLYSPFFTYRVTRSEAPAYEASGYDAWETWTSDQAEQRDILNRYQIGENYPCWYNPANANEVLLNKEGSSLPWFLGLLFLGIGLLFGIIALGIALRKLFTSHTQTSSGGWSIASDGTVIMPSSSEEYSFTNDEEQVTVGANEHAHHIEDDLDDEFEQDFDEDENFDDEDDKDAGEDRHDEPLFASDRNVRSDGQDQGQLMTADDNNSQRLLAEQQQDRSSTS